jgi:hypothetical protein
MFWVILLVLGVAIGFGYWLRSKRPNKKEHEKIDVLNGWKSIVDERMAEFKGTMTRDEKWAVVIGLSIMEAAMIIVILPALTGSMVRAQEVGFFSWTWRMIWWATSIGAAIFLATKIWKTARYKVCPAKEGEDKKGGE